MTQSSNRFAIIMAGGKGERFWPLSTAKRPKQLLSLATGTRPLILQAVDRLSGVIPEENILIVTNHDLSQAIYNLLGAESKVAVLGEPVGRDTAAAIAAGAAWIKSRNPNGVFCVLTADHVIGDLDVFQSTLLRGLELCAAEPVLMTIGIPPTEPSSAYGYIEAGAQWDKAEKNEPFYCVRRFVEKPDRATAEAYIESGDYSWNSGMFIWSVPTLVAAYQEYVPVLADRLEAWSKCKGCTGVLESFLAKDFPSLEKISVDYALMEKATNIIMCRGAFAWDDVGSWPALEAHLPKDEAGNAVQGDVVSVESAGNIVLSNDRLTALVGVKDLVVVQTDDVTLVCDRAHSQDIKLLLAKLRGQEGRAELM